MKMNDLSRDRRLKLTLPEIDNHIYTEIGQLKVTAWLTDEPISFEDRQNGDERNLKPGDNWGSLFGCAWMNFTGTIPTDINTANVVLLIDISGEAYVVDENGNPVQGLTTVSSMYDFKLGMPGKKVVYLDKLLKGSNIDIWADCGNNDLFGEFPNNGKLMEASVALMNPNMLELYFDYEVLIDLLNRLPKKSARYAKINDALYRAAQKLKEYTDDEVALARNILKVELARENADAPLNVTAIGHSHIDLAWLWPIRETKRKAARTFSTVFMNMDKYPEYVFGASQPQLYQWIKELYPNLYEKIHIAFEEKRWELQGGMWVEPDTNVSGGEALIRQILYGKNFFRDEFGFEVKNLWLPDVFGYSAALPQILKKSGIDYFMTIKISWNESNDFPHQTFIWKGLDGSEVLAHMPPEGNYNSSAAPRAIRDIEEKYHDKDKCDECLLLYGIGDGGGGPGEEHLERLKREKNLQGIAPVKQGFASDLFERLNKNYDLYDKWSGELYLEHHRGTYTSEGRNKRFNKIMENLLRDAEIISVIKNGKYPQSDFESIWKEILLYQFHDILPGSSIKRVYDESCARYELLEKEVTDIIESNTEKDDRLIFNTLSWERSDWLKYNGKWRFYNNAGPLSFSYPEKENTENFNIKIDEENRIISNTGYKVKFNERGEVISFIDEFYSGETIPAGLSSNALSVYKDTGDAWDFPYDYREMELEKPSLISMHFESDGPEAKMVAEYKFRESSIRQEVVLGEESKRLEFRTVLDWHDKNTMLRSCFPLMIESDELTCGIQFGHLKRPSHNNTDWDQAKFEVCAQNYVDKSQLDKGVSVLSDYKYGYSSTLDTIELNLLRSTVFPDTEGDIGTQKFSYALYPHAHDHIQGNVIKEAMEFIHPLKAVGKPKSGIVDNSPFIQTNSESIFIETIKKAEKVEGTVVRLYEPYGSGIEDEIFLNKVYNKITEVNLMEDVIYEVAENTDTFKVVFKPFEIKTYLLK